MNKRVPIGSFMRRDHAESDITYENALKDWSIRYVLMCDYLDEIDAGNLAHLDQLIVLCETEKTEDAVFGWCSYDLRLQGINIDGQKFHSDSEGCTYELSQDVNYKVAKLKRWLHRLQDAFKSKGQN